MSSLPITAKGQITITPELLRHLNVASGQEVEVRKLPNGQLITLSAAGRGSIKEFSGCLAKEGTPRLTITQIKKFAEGAWAGER